MAYQCDWKESGSILTFSGELNIQEINEANGVLHGDSRTEKHDYSIWNFLGANLSSVTLDEMAQPAAIDRAAATYIHRIRVALVAEEDHAVQICECYIERAKLNESNWSFALFESMGEATKWACS